MQTEAVLKPGSSQKTEPGKSSRPLALEGISLLLVEDDLALQEAIVDTLELAGCCVLAAASAEQGLTVLQGQAVDMVVTDVNMKGMDGHGLLKSLRQSHPCLPVLLITAYGSIERSVDAIKNGAVDYLVKPFEPKALIELIAHYATPFIADAAAPIIEDAATKSVFEYAARVALTDATVLLTGESGTGKEVLAQYIHARSDRADKPFVALNCAAIPESMLEAMLFGHEKGAFTGAHQSTAGKFEQANGGTLLLDEISEMDISLQAKLLRVLQEREVERLGGRNTIELDLRIIATTNRDLQAYVAQGKFREDLFYRLSVFPLALPPLRERPGDILPLAERFIQKHTAKLRRTAVQLSSGAQQMLLGHSWPGNVRELDNMLQRALVLQNSSIIETQDLSPGSEMSLNTGQSTGATVTSLFNDAALTDDDNAAEESTNQLDANLKQTEYQIILDALQRCRGSKKETAQALGVSPRTLRYKMAKMRELGMLDS